MRQGREKMRLSRESNRESNGTIPMHTALGIFLLACFIMFKYLLKSIDVIALIGIELILLMSEKLRMRFEKSDYC